MVPKHFVYNNPYKSLELGVPLIATCKNIRYSYAVVLLRFDSGRHGRFLIFVSLNSYYRVGTRIGTTLFPSSTLLQMPDRPSTCDYIWQISRYCCCDLHGLCRLHSYLAARAHASVSLAYARLCADRPP